MTDKQPEALRLAYWLERDGANCQQHVDAAAELRRLHALNLEWEAKAATWLASPAAAHRLAGYRELAAQRNAAELMSLALKVQRDELLEALRSISLASQDSGSTREGMGLYARAAIARAEGKQ